MRWKYIIEKLLKLRKGKYNQVINTCILSIVNMFFFLIIYLEDMISLKDALIYCGIIIFFLFVGGLSKYKEYVLLTIISIYSYIFMEIGAFETVSFLHIPGTVLINCLLVFMILVLIYVMTNHLLLSVYIVEIIAIAFGIVNYFLILYRERGLFFSDLFSARTALGVVESYELDLNFFLICLIIFLCIFPILYIKINKINKINRNKSINWKKKIIRGCVVFCSICLLYNENVLNFFGFEVYWWSLIRQNGFLVGFVLQGENFGVHESSNYSVESIENLKEEYDYSSNNNETPDIIVVMNESFSDLSVIGELPTNQEVMPYFNSLENCIKGNLYTSVKAGNTANSEYEFLTGDTMAFYQYGSVPYISYMDNEIVSNVSYLKQMGYETQSFHPWYKSGWNRESVYQNLGFDGLSFVEDLTDIEYLRVYPSDSYNYSKLNNIYNSMSDSPRFIFNITMQNHASYDPEYGEIEQKVWLTGDMEEYSLATQYLSLVNESDTALETLIDQYKDSNRKVVICFFGDHQPGLENEFFEELYGKSLDSLTLEEEQKQYITPFLIWTNYDIEEKDIEMTSINYLFAILMDVCPAIIKL